MCECVISVGIIDMFDIDYAEYRCSACKKDIKNIAVQCKKCRNSFTILGVLLSIKFSKHELVKCEGPFEKVRIESEKAEDINRLVEVVTERGRIP